MVLTSREILCVLFTWSWEDSVFRGRCQGSAAVGYKVKKLCVCRQAVVGRVNLCSVVFRNSSCSTGMTMFFYIWIRIFYIYACVACLCLYIFIFIYIYIYSLSWESPCPDHLCLWSSHVAPCCSVFRWQRHGEAACGAGRADGGAWGVAQDGLAVTRCLSRRGRYHEEFLQSWPPQGTAELHILHLPSSQTVWTDCSACSWVFSTDFSLLLVLSYYLALSLKRLLRILTFGWCLRETL